METQKMPMGVECKIPISVQEQVIQTIESRITREEARLEEAAAADNRAVAQHLQRQLIILRGMLRHRQDRLAAAQ